MGGMSPTVGEGRGASSANLLTVGDGLEEALWQYLSVDKKRVYIYEPLLSADKMGLYLFHMSLSTDNLWI